MLALCAKFCMKETDGFSILAISSHRPYNSDWQVPLREPEKVDQALSQPYHYLGSGSQCFVFTSQDGNYVLKFFKQRIYSPSAFLNRAPLPWFLHRYREKNREKRLDKCARDFASYKMAFEELQEETQLLYVHLNPTDFLKKTVFITDKLHIRHEILLDKLDFILQRRAEPAFDHIQRLMGQGKKKEAKQAILSLRTLIENRCRKGFKDRDPDIRTNCGFVGEKAVKLDVGRFERNNGFQDPKVCAEEIETVMAPFHCWIKTFYPSLNE